MNIDIEYVLWGIAGKLRRKGAIGRDANVWVENGLMHCDASPMCFAGYIEANIDKWTLYGPFIERNDALAIQQAMEDRLEVTKKAASGEFSINLCVSMSVKEGKGLFKKDMTCMEVWLTVSRVRGGPGGPMAYVTICKTEGLLPECLTQLERLFLGYDLSKMTRVSPSFRAAEAAFKSKEQDQTPVDGMSDEDRLRALKQRLETANRKDAAI